MKLKNIQLKQYVALILALIMIFSSFDLLAVAEDDLPEGNQLNGWYVDCFWGNGSKTYNMVSSYKQDIDVKLTVEYYAPLSVMTRNVEPGTVKFSVPDIGGVKRGGAKFEPVALADGLDSDWNYSYDVKTNCYVFTNKTMFEANKPLSGGFEMKWKLSSRECTDGYYIKQNPVFTIGSDSMKMYPLEFSCHTKRDYYQLSIYKEYMDYNDSFGNEINNEDYITYVYRTYFSVYQRARGGEKNTYFVKVTIDDDTVTDEQYEEIIYRYNNKNHHLTKMKFPYSDEEVWGFYCFVDDPSEILSTDKFYVSYPKSLNGKNSIIDTYLSVHYYDEEKGKYVNYLSPDLNSNERLTTEIIAPIKFYTYTYGGGGYDLSKKNQYESYVHQIDGTYSGLETNYAEKYLSKNIYNNEIVRFSVRGTYSMTTSAGASAPVKYLTTADEAAASGRVCHTTASGAAGTIDDPTVDLSTVFDMVIGDDRLYIKKNNDTLRHVEADEYEIAGLTLQSTPTRYEYDIYVSDVGYTSVSQTVANNRPGQNDYRLYTSGNTKYKRIVDFSNIKEKAGFESYTDGVKAVYVVIHGIQKSFLYEFNIDFRFRFDQYKELNLPEEERIDTEGELTNEGYMRMFKSDGGGNLCARTGNDYADSHYQGTGKLFDSDEYIAEDMLMDSRAYTDNYDPVMLTNNEMLYHSWSSVYLRDITTTLSTITQVTSEQRNKNEGAGYNIHIQSQGAIVSDNYGANGIKGDLSSFSLYTRIPSVLTFDHQLSEIALNNCYAWDVYGNRIRLSDFKEHVVYRIFESTNGEMIIAADFDFSETPLDVSTLINVRMDIPAVLTYADFKASETKAFEVMTYLMLQDDGIQKIIAKTSPTVDTEDFNGNGITTEPMASSAMGITYEEILEWKDTAEKYVKSYSDDTWNIVYDAANDCIISETTVNARSTLLDAQANKRAEYSYKLNVDLGSRSSDIVFTDIMENEPGTAWRGKVCSIDFSEAKAQGLVPTVYYSTSKKVYRETIIHADTATYTSNISEFTREADGQWNADHSLWTAPVNNIATLVVKLSTENLTDNFISKQQVSVVVNMIAPDYTAASPINQYAVNAHKVYYTGHTDLYDNRKNAQSAEAKVMLKEPMLLVTMKKTDSDTGKPLLGAEFSFYSDSDCQTPVVENVKVNNLGEVFINGLIPGTYYYKEVKAPNGYLIDSTVHEIDVTGNDKTYKLDPGLIITNEKLKGKLIFSKKDADDPDGPGLQGAEYELYYPSGINVCTNGKNEYQETGGTKSTFVTDKNGKIEIKELPWGVYYLQEKAAPQGYEINDEKIWVAVTKNTNPQEQETQNAIVVYYVQTDEQKTASVRLIKYDQDGNTPLENAWFSLEKKESDGTWQTLQGHEYLKTARNGSVTVKDLKFGTYRFRELNAPVGYEMPSGNAVYSKEIVLDATTTDSVQTVSMTNERVLGSATLRKYSDNGVPVNGAKFNLYLVNGEVDDLSVAGDPADTLIRSGLVTATRNGRIGMLETITDLAWGRYYFKEVYAPAGYEKKNTVYEFVISAANASTTVGDLDPVNDRKKGEIMLTKKAGEPVDTSVKHYNTGDEIEGAVFSLVNSDTNEKLWLVPDDPASPMKYTVGNSTDANAVQAVSTDSHGQLHIDGIEWGTYYLEEVISPDGFSAADKVRFTVNSINCLSVQQLECEDFGVKCLLTIDKEIDDKLDVFGTPTFLFKVEKLDASDHTEKEYLCQIVLSGEDKTGTVSMYVEPGRYRVSEIKVNRYHLTETHYVDAGTTVPAANRRIHSNEFEFTISGSGSTYEKAEVYFYNTLENYSGLSHNGTVVNIVPTKRKMTGFSVVLDNQVIDCDESQYHDYVIHVTDLKGFITYDDGETVDMTAAEFARVFPLEHLSDSSVVDWTVNNGFEYADTSFIEHAVYTDENGKIFKSDFIVSIGSYHNKESQKVLFINDENNASVFEVDNKSFTSNTVYYNEVNGELTAVSGSYLKPVPVSGYCHLQAWKIIGGSDNGKVLPPQERSVKKYLAERYDSGLRDLKLQAVLADDVYDFYPSEEEQEITAPKDGIYFIECWGGNGGDAVVNGTVMAKGGKGGYSYAWLYLKEGETVHMVVGGNGADAVELNKTAQGGYNGGASARSSDDTYYAAGGGATHFYIEKVGSGVLSEYNSDENRSKIIIAAGGGGGGSYSTTSSPGGNGGGEIGGAGAGTGTPGTGGTQTAGGTGESSGSFGQGGENLSGNSAGGGGGWYGGGSGSDGASAGGGSGYVNESRVIIGETIGGNEVADDGHVTVSFLDDEIDLPDAPVVHKFIAPVSGYYLMEAWGAAGGSSLKNGSAVAADGSFDESAVQEGGRGGYASGKVYLTAGQAIYYVVGKKGNNSYIHQQAAINEGSASGGYGGGGNQTVLSDGIWNSGSGGGSTYFMLNKTGNGNLSDYASDMNNLLLAAGGGGGSGYYYKTDSEYGNGIGGCGGGKEAQSGYSITASGISVTNAGNGGKQSPSNAGANGGSFGQGGHGAGGTTGGGGGLYGGDSGLASGGGSGYVNVQYVLESRNVNGIYEGSYTDSSGTEISPEYIPTFSGAIVDNGVVGTTSTDTQMYGNRGDGFARITYIPRTQVVDYAYTGFVQSFTASVSGYYKLEAWGAQGGDASENKEGSVTMREQPGGRGGYSYGTVYLSAGQTIYLAVGGAGGELYKQPGNTVLAGGFNGGGMAIADVVSNTQGAGGGATHFSLTLRGSGVLSDYESKKNDVLLVAGGGGGSYSSAGIKYYSMGGNGGGENGGDAILYYFGHPDPLVGRKYNGVTYYYYQGLQIPGGGQTATMNDGIYVYGTFGQGASCNGNSIRDLEHSGTDSGAGGGWYGGARLCNVSRGGMAGGGGSGHCNSNYLVEEYGYATIGGENTFVAPDGSQEDGHSGDGYARVTLVEEKTLTVEETVSNSYEFDYTGASQTFTAPSDGYYKLEAWGAQGGNANGFHGGRGAYTSGVIYLHKDETIYVYVGGAGTGKTYVDAGYGNNPGGFNGGGIGKSNGVSNTSNAQNVRIFASGGGATDFRLVASDAADGWSGFDSLKSRIMVASGGGGGHYSDSAGRCKPGGYGGALVGGEGACESGNQYSNVATGGTQIAGGYCKSYNTGKGQFGYADDTGCSENGHCGGGSGYYAGGTSQHTSAGAGGSSYISGYQGCNAIGEASVEGGIIHTGQSNHYSGMVFSNTVMIAGNELMPDYEGYENGMIGNAGNGYAKITRLA